MGMDSSTGLGVRWALDGASGVGAGSGAGAGSGVGKGTGSVGPVGSDAAGPQASSSARVITTATNIDRFFIIHPPKILVAHYAN